MRPKCVTPTYVYMKTASNPAGLTILAWIAYTQPIDVARSSLLTTADQEYIIFQPCAITGLFAGNCQCKNPGKRYSVGTKLTGHEVSSAGERGDTRF